MKISSSVAVPLALLLSSAGCGENADAPPLAGNGAVPTAGAASMPAGLGGEMVGRHSGGGGGASGQDGQALGSGGVDASGGTGNPAGSGGVAGGAADPMLPFAGYDQNVTFNWTESTDSTGICKAGTYEGTFDGLYAPGIAVFPAPIPVLGNILITLEESADGEFFNIADGKVIGLALAAFPFEAQIRGRLNCTTSQLEDGFLDDGIYFVGPLFANFSGPITADYDKLTQAFVNATWDVGEPAWAQPKPIYGGFGTWQARWTGP